MKPSRIVKSAWLQAGKPGSLKSFARTCSVSQCYTCELWLKNKRKQRSASASTSHRDVYTRAGIRRSL